MKRSTAFILFAGSISIIVALAAGGWLAFKGENKINDDSVGPAAQAASLSFQPGGLDGAGGQMVIAVDPHQPEVLLSGADAAGVNRSTDGGNTWALSNQGLVNKEEMQIASLAFSKDPAAPNRVYAAVGKLGKGGGFAISEDSGHSWRIASRTPQFAGGNTGDDLPNPYPRSTGNLIAEDAANGALYVGTYREGMMRSTDGGSHWQKIGLNEGEQYIRSIALDPADPRQLYAAVYGKGVFRTGDAGASNPSWEPVSGTSPVVEELKFINGELYAVGTDETGESAVGAFISLGGKALSQLGKVNRNRAAIRRFMRLTVMRRRFTSAPGTGSRTAGGFTRMCCVPPMGETTLQRLRARRT